MALYIVTGNYTSAAMRGMLAKPSDREAATRILIESAGGKLNSYLLTTGDTDFSMIVQAPDASRFLSALIVAGASGSVANLKSVQAFTSAEFMAAQHAAGDIAAKYQPPA